MFRPELPEEKPLWSMPTDQSGHATPLSRRDYFAMVFMQEAIDSTPKITYKQAAKLGVRKADKLISALDALTAMND